MEKLKEAGNGRAQQKTKQLIREGLLIDPDELRLCCSLLSPMYLSPY